MGYAASLGMVAVVVAAVDVGDGIAAGAANAIRLMNEVTTMMIRLQQLQVPMGNWHAAENEQNASSGRSPNSSQVRRELAPVPALVPVTIRAQDQILSQTRVQASRHLYRRPIACSP